jgi:hypothetical protein
MVLWWTPVWAQDTNSASGQSGGSAQNMDQSGEPNGQEKVDADTRPVSGAEFLTTGTPESARNVLNASIHADERADSNSSGTGTGSSWTADTDLYGDATLNRSWKRESFTAQYDGGATFYGDSNPQTIQFLKLSQVFGWRRWTLTLSDQVTYAPESPFGFAGPWAFSIGYVGTKPVLLPNQTVLTGQSTRISNTSLGEADYELSRRSSLTAIASYGLLDYFNINAVDSNQINGSVGYNYAITPHNKFGLSYGYEDIHFLNNTSGESRTEVQAPSAGYAFQATGRLSFQVSAGAQLVKSLSPGIPAINNLYPFGQATITYSWHRAQVGLLGSQSVLSGGGLYPAARTTLAQVSLSRMLSRKWDGTIIAGYARNSPLQAYLTTTNQLSQTGYAGATVRRRLGRSAGIFIFYNFQRQDVNTFCTNALCAESYIGHSIGAGIDWRFKPLYFHVKEQ